MTTVLFELLSTGFRSGNLSCLSFLGFVQCTGMKTKFTLLFSYPFPNLTHVNMIGTDADNVDMSIFDEQKSPTLQLQSLALTVNDTNDLASLFKHKNVALQELFLAAFNDKVRLDPKQLWLQIPNLSKLGFSNFSLDLIELHLNKLTSLTWLSLHECGQILTVHSSCSNLSCLDITGSQNVCGKLSVLLSQNFRSLKTLILRRCMLNSEDFSNLAQASAKGRLSKLKHLDVSLNNVQIQTKIQSLFTHGSSWNQLSSFDVTELYIQQWLLTAINERIYSGCLQSLQELTFCDCIISPHSTMPFTSWYKLKTLRVHRLTIGGLNTIISAVHKGLFPSLHTVCIVSYIDGVAVESDRLPYEAPRLLTRLGVSCREAIPSDDPFVPGRCLCQQFNA